MKSNHKYTPITLAMVALAAALGACATPGARPDAPIDARPADAAMDEALAQMTAQPFVAYLRPGQLKDVDAALGGTLMELGAPPQLTRVLDTAIDGLALGAAVTLPGLDPERPVVMGLGEALEPDATRFAAMGALIDAQEVPAAFHTRAMLPTNDPNALLGELEGWGRGQGWLILAPGEVAPELGSAVMMAGTGLALVATPTPGWVQVDAVFGPDAGQAPEALLVAAGRAGLGAWPQTPAVAHLREGDGAAGLRVDMEGWARLAQQLMARDIALSLEAAAPAARLPMHAAGAELTLDMAVALHAAGRQVHDATISMEASAGADLRLTRTLTPRGREAHARARARAGSVYAPREAAPALLQLRFSQRARREGLRPTTGQGQPIAALRPDLSPQSLLYALADGDWGWLAPLLGLEADQLGALMPDSLSLAVTRILPPIGGVGPTRVTGGAVLEYPTGPAPEALRQLAAQAAHQPGDEVHRLLVSIEEGVEGAPTRVFLGINQPAEALFDLARPLGDAPEVTLRLRGDGLRPLTDAFPEHPLARLVRSLGDVSMTSRSAGACDASRIRLGDAGEAPPAPVLAPTPAPLAARSPSRGATCMASAAVIFREVAGALARGQLPPDTRASEALTLAFTTMEPELMCAEDDPDTARAAQATRAAWHLFRARQAALGRRLHEAGDHATIACNLGRATGCALKESLRPPYPEQSLALPQVTWRAGLLPTQVPILAVTAEGIYLGEDRLTDLAQIDPPAGAALLVELLGERLEANAPVNVAMDGELGWARVGEVLKALGHIGARPLLVGQGDDGQQLSAPILTSPSRTAPSRPLLELRLDANGFSLWLGGEPLMEAPPGAPSAEAVASAVREATSASSADAPVLHVTPAGTLNWSQVAAMLDGLLGGALRLDFGPTPQGGFSDAPRAIFSTITVQGPLERASAWRTLLATRPQLSRCFAEAWRDDRKLSGDATIRLKVSANGLVEAAQVTADGVGRPDVARCAADQLKRVLFDPADKGSQLTVPLTFTAGPAP